MTANPASSPGQPATCTFANDPVAILDRGEPPDHTARYKLLVVCSQSCQSRTAALEEAQQPLLSASRFLTLQGCQPSVAAVWHVAHTGHHY